MAYFVSTAPLWSSADKSAAYFEPATDEQSVQLKLFKSPAEQLEKHLQRASVIDVCWQDRYTMLTSAGWVVSGLVRRDKTETVRLAIDKTLAKDKRRIVCGLILDKAILTLRDGATELHALHKSSGVPKLYADGSHTLPWSDVKTTSRTLSSSPSWLGGRMIANAEGTRVAFLDAHGFELFALRPTVSGHVCHHVHLALDSVACQTLSDEEQLLGGCLAGRQLLLAQQTLALDGRAIIKFVRYEEAAAGDWKPVSNSKSAQVVLAARAASITFAPQTRTAKQQFLVCCDDGSLLCGLLSIQDNAQDEAQVLSKTRNVKSPALQAAFVINSDVLGAVHRDASFRLFDAALHDLPIVTEGKRMSPPQLSNMVSVSLRALGSQQQAVWQPRLLEEGVVDQDVYANVSCIVTLERSTPVLVRLELGSPVETQMWSLTTISRSLTVSDYGKVERVLSVLKEARHADCDEWIVSLSYIFRHLYVHGMLQQIEKQDLMLRLCDFDVPQYQREVDMIARKLVGILMSTKRYEVALGIALRRQQVDLLHMIGCCATPASPIIASLASRQLSKLMAEAQQASGLTKLVLAASDRRPSASRTALAQYKKQLADHYNAKVCAESTKERQRRRGSDNNGRLACLLEMDGRTSDAIAVWSQCRGSMDSEGSLERLQSVAAVLDNLY